MTPDALLLAFGCHFVVSRPVRCSHHQSAVTVIPGGLPQKLVVVASGVDGTVYPALRQESSTADSMIVEKIRVLLGCTNNINVPDMSKFLRNMYPIDDDSL